MSSGNVKKFELKLERTGVIIVVVGMTILLCLSFILGVGVGKNMDAYPEKISSFPQRVLALFWRPAKIIAQPEPVESKETKQKPEEGNMDLAFHKALTSQKLPSMQPAPAVETIPEMPPVAEPIKEEKIPQKEEMLEPKVQVSEKTSSEKKSKIKEVPAPAPPASSSFLIHVTSLKDKAKASQINKTIVELGYSSKVVKVDLKKKGIWYRVIVTGFETKAKAQAAAGRITKKVKTNCVVWPAGGNAGKTP